MPPDAHGKIYADVMGLLHTTYQPLVAPPVRRSARVAEAHAQAVPLPSWSPTDKVTSDYHDVHNWLKGRGVL